MTIDRRGFLKSGATSALFASMAGGFGARAAGAELHGSGPPPGSSIGFSREEYEARWARVQAAMAAAGYENLVVWQRSAGTYDKVGDVYWLTNFQIYGTGQDPATEATGAPWTFCRRADAERAGAGAAHRLGRGKYRPAKHRGRQDRDARAAT